jgi:hypothetical protein
VASPAAEDKRTPLDVQSVENPKNFDNEVRLLPKFKQQALGEANDDTIMMSEHPTASINKKHLTKSEKRYMDDCAKHRNLPKKPWPNNSTLDISDENPEKKLAALSKPVADGDKNDTRV